MTCIILVQSLQRPSSDSAHHWLFVLDVNSFSSWHNRFRSQWWRVRQSSQLSRRWFIFRGWESKGLLVISRKKSEWCRLWLPDMNSFVLIVQSPKSIFHLVRQYTSFMIHLILRSLYWLNPFHRSTKHTAKMFVPRTLGNIFPRACCYLRRCRSYCG